MSSNVCPCEILLRKLGTFLKPHMSKLKCKEPYAANVDNSILLDKNERWWIFWLVVFQTEWYILTPDSTYVNGSLRLE